MREYLQLGGINTLELIYSTEQVHNEFWYVPFGEESVRMASWPD
jgi:hypothetical protein